MAFTFTVFQTISDKLLEPVVQTMDNAISGLSSSLSGPFTAAATIYIMFLGYNVIYGRSQMPIWDFIATAVKLGILVALVTKTSEYNYWVKNLFFTDLPNAITGAMKITGVDTNTWDAMITNAVGNVYKVAKDASLWRAIIVWIAGIICIIVAALFCVIGFIVTLFAQIGLSLILSLGPLFIAFYLFSSTRNFTQAWLGQLANFIILQVLVILLGGLYVDITMNIFKQGIEDIFFTLAQFVAVGLCGAYLFINLPGIATALAAGGASLSSGQLSSQAATAARSTIKKAYNKIRGK